MLPNQSAMKGEARKLHLIEALLKIEDENVLAEMESLLSIKQIKPVERKNFADFSGVITEEEAEEWKRAIEDAEGCGHPDCLYKK